MIEDFLELSNCAAELLNGSPKNAVSVFLFLPSRVESELPILAIAWKEKLPELLEFFSARGFRQADKEEAIMVTGYKPGFIPPVSIYGMKVLLDRELEKRNSLAFRVSVDRFLRISAREIISLNESVEIAGF